MDLSRIKHSVKARLRRHVLDALDHRGLVEGWRVEFPSPRQCRLVKFEEADCGPGQVLVENLFTSVSVGTETAAFRNEAGSWVTFPFPVGYSGLWSSQTLQNQHHSGR